MIFIPIALAISRKPLSGTHDVIRIHAAHFALTHSNILLKFIILNRNIFMTEEQLYKIYRLAVKQFKQLFVFIRNKDNSSYQ